LRRRERISELARKDEKDKNEPLLRELDLDRCRLLGLYARQRPQDAKPPEESQALLDIERTMEIEFARYDRNRGHRHSVKELVHDGKRQPSVPGRKPWLPPRVQDIRYEEFPGSLKDLEPPDDYLSPIWSDEATEEDREMGLA
jgi:hypothetical protein